MTDQDIRACFCIVPHLLLHFGFTHTCQRMSLLTVHAHFQKIISSTVSNLSTRQQNGCKANHQSPSALRIITRSYSSQCLGQHRLFQGRQRGITDEGHLSCFSELHKKYTIAFHVTAVCRGQAWRSPHSCKYLCIETEQKGLYGGKSTNEPAL